MAGLHIPITATDKNVSSKLDQVSRKIDELASKAQASNNTMIDSNSKLGASFGALASKVGASVAAIASVQKLNEIRQNITQVRGELEQLEISLSTILGSKAEADKLMAQVVDFAAKTPFDMKGVASGVKQLLAYGSSADSVIDEMRMLGDIASGLSIPLGDMVYLFGTTRTQGRMFTQDLRQFMGRGIPLAEELAKQFGVTKSEVGELVTAGKVGFNEMYKALQAMTSEGGKFYNLMDAQSRSILGMQSNADDARDKMYNEIGKLLQGVTAKGIEAQNYLYENYEKIGKTLLELVGIYGTYKAVLITANAIMKLHATYARMQVIGIAMFPASYGKATTATLIFTRAQKVLLTTLKATGKAMLANPYVLSAAAVAGLAYGIYKLVTAKSAEEKALEATNKRLQDYNEGIEKRMNNANDLISAMKDENKSSSERRESMRKLAQQYPQLLEKYGEEALMLMDIRDLKREIVGIESTNKKSDLEEDIKTLKKLKTIYEGNGNFKTVDVGERGHELIKEHGIQQSSYSHSLEVVNKALSETQKRLNDIYKAEADAAFANKSIEERLKIYEDRAEEARKKVKELNDEIDKLNSKPQKPGVPFAGAEGGGGVPNFIGNYVDLQAQRDAEIKAAEDAEKNAEALRKKQEEDKKVADQKAREEAKKAEKEINKNVLKSNQERQKAELQQKIDLLQYSTKAEKEKEEELHNLRKEMLQIEQALALETLDLEYKKYKAIFEAAGKDTKPLDDAFAKLEQNTVDSFNQKSKKEDADYAKKKKDREEQALDDMIAYNEKYGNIMERRAAIVQKYARLIEKAENDAQKKTLEKERDRELREFDSQNSLEYYLMFIDTSEATIKQIDRAIVLVENKIEELLKNGVDASSEELQNLREQLDGLRSIKLGGIAPKSELSALSKYWAYTDMVIKKRKELEKMKHSLKSEEDVFAFIKTGQQLSDLEEQLRNLKLDATLSTLSISLKSVGEGIKQIGEASDDVTLRAIGETLSFFSGAFDAFNNGYQTGGLEGGAFQMSLYSAQVAVNNLSNAMAKEAEYAKEINNSISVYINKVKLLAVQLDESEYDSMFGTNSIKKAQEAYKIAQEALEKFKESEEELKKTKVVYKARGWGKSDYKKTLEDLSKEEGWNVWDENGEFNVSAAKLLLATHEYLSESQKEALTNAIEYQEAYEAALAVIEQIGSQIFGNLASEFADGIINAVEKGEDAFDSFGKSAGNVIKNLGKMFLQSMLYEKIFDNYSEQLNEAIGSGNAEQLTNLTGQMLDDMKNIYPELYEWYNNLMKQAEERGIDTDAVAEQEATAKGFQAMSQDTGDELNGRFTDIQAKSGMIAIGVNSLVQINTSIFQNTSAMLLQLGEMFGIQNLQLKELNTISRNTGYLLTIYEEISALRRQFTNNIG